MRARLLTVLLWKDLRRARRNPVPYLIHLCLPLVITGLLGLMFSGRGSGSSPLGEIRVAVVDEDDSALTRLLRGALSQDGGAERLESRFLPREEALREVTNGTVAAAVVLPRGFTRDFLAGREGITVELIKNPAQQIHPAVVEEGLGVLVTALNAAAQNFGPDLAAWRDLLTKDPSPSPAALAGQVEKTAARIEAARRRLDPIPVGFERETRPSASTGPPRQPGGTNLFAYLLPGLAAMFLVFLADVAMRDLHREVRERTFERFCTLPQPAWIFVLGKVLFALVMVSLGAAVLLGGGGWVFRFAWRQPMAVLALALSFSLFATGLMAALAGIVGGGRRGEVLNTLVAMGLGLAGGGAFPAESLPPFLREHVTAHLPTAWYIDATRASQDLGSVSAAWPGVAAQLAALGLLLTLSAAWLLRRRLESGHRVAA